MDKLDILFEKQKQLNDFMAKKRGLPENFDSINWIQREVLAVISELSELLDELQFKWWKAPSPINETKVKEELIDLLHFFISMCIHAGMTSDEMISMYLAKNQENINRQIGKSTDKDYTL